MNLIVCDQHCHHQQEGYCTLNHIASLTSQIGANCGYFTERTAKGHGANIAQENTSAPYYADRL